MKTTTSTYRWIAALLAATLLFGPLAPILAHACSGMAEMSVAGASMANASTTDASSATAHAHVSQAKAHASEALRAAVSSGTSHDCNGPCAGSDCCSMQATPTPQSDVFLAERVQSVTATVSVVSDRLRALFPRADRAPPVPPQPDRFPSLLSARLHVWTATFLT